MKGIVPSFLPLVWLIGLAHHRETQGIWRQHPSGRRPQSLLNATREVPGRLSLKIDAFTSFINAMARAREKGNIPETERACCRKWHYFADSGMLPRKSDKNC